MSVFSAAHCLIVRLPGASATDAGGLVPIIRLTPPANAL
jgi:hypothetical protein